MSIKFALSAFIKIVNFYTGKPVEDVKLLYSGMSAGVVYKGSGIFAVFNWNREPMEYVLQKKGYISSKFILEDTGKEVEYVVIPIKELRIDTVKILCHLENKNQKESGILYYGIILYERKNRIIKDAKKGSIFIKTEGASDLSEEYRKIIIEGSKCMYIIIGYDSERKMYILNKPLDNDIDAGNVIIILNEDYMNESKFEVEMLKNQCEDGKIIAFFKDKIYEAEIDKENDKIKAIFKEC